MKDVSARKKARWMSMRVTFRRRSGTLRHPQQRNCHNHRNNWILPVVARGAGGGGSHRAEHSKRRRIAGRTLKTYTGHHCVRKPGKHFCRTVKDIISVNFFKLPTVRFLIFYVFLVLAHNVVGSFTSRPLLIPRRSGSRSNYEKPSPRSQRRAFSCAPRVSRSRYCVQRKLSAPVSSIVHRQLSPEPNAFELREGHAGAAPNSAASAGQIMAIPQVGGLPHRYERRAV